MLTFVIFLVVLGLLVFVHEFGHFLLAKRAGVRVEAFSLGFGPRLIGKKYGDTDYRICAVPLGGYVKMVGEDPQDEDSGHEDSFAKKSVGARMKIVIAGPLMNLALPFILMPLVYLIGLHQPAYLDQPAVVGWVEEDSPGQEIGVQAGDRIAQIQGEEILTWERAKIVFAANPGTPLQITLQRQSERIQLEITPEPSGHTGGYTGLLHDMPPVISAVSPNMPAAEAGFKAGDRILSINDEPMQQWVQMASVIRSHPKEPLRLILQRGEESISVTVTPKAEKDPETDAEFGLLGIAPEEPAVFKRYGLWKSIKSGFGDIVETFKLTFYVLGKLFTGGLSIKTLGGPILIAKLTGDAARVGISSLLSFMAFLSLQLGILNLLPIPVLDGGYVLFLSLEAILRRPVNVKIREAAQQTGMVLLLIFITIISFNDIMRLIPFDIGGFFK